MFGFADVTMGLLALVNLVAIALLFKIGMRLMHDYDAQIKAGVEEPVFDASKFADLDIDHDAWNKKAETSSTEAAGKLAQSHR
ncbi:Sodium:alanine symporter family protein [compost metagenome]